jgi:hypothetical protein
VNGLPSGLEPGKTWKTVAARKGRHARPGNRGYDYGDSQPSRSHELASAVTDDPAREKAPGRQKRGECKGPDGWHTTHDPVITWALDQLGREDRDCGWRPFGCWDKLLRVYAYVPAWTCRHEEKCQRCSHLITQSYSMKQRCPLFTGQPVPASVLADCERKEAEAAERTSNWRWARKPVITGPQGYRKRKKDQE